MRGTGACSDLSELALVLAVGKNLLPAQVLLLHGPLALFLLLHLLLHFCLSQLQASLVHDLSLFLSIESFEVVGSDTVLREHALFAGRVLNHEVVVRSACHIGLSLELLVCALSVISVTLLLCELEVGILDGLLHGDALGSMVLLGGLEHLGEMLLLVVVDGVSELLLLLEHLPLSDLLVNPVLLL